MPMSMSLLDLMLVALSIACIGRVHSSEESAMRWKYISLSTREDITLAVRNYQSIWDTVTWFCGQERAKCMNNCGERKANSYFQQTERVTCSCDYSCIAYEDCCHDFYEACPKEVAKFRLSTLGQATPECNGSYVFLSYDNSITEGNSSAESVLDTPVSMKELLDYMSLRGPTITDTLTRNQYSSLGDLRKIHPKQDFSNPGRLSYWKPTLLRKSKYDHVLEKAETKYWMKIIQNQTISFAKRLKFTFAPPNDTSQSRMSMPKASLSCPDITNRFDIKNMTLACQVVANMSAFEDANDTEVFDQWSYSETGSSAATATTETEVTNSHTSLTTLSQRFSFASATGYRSTTTEAATLQPFCIMEFGYVSGRGSPDFSYLLKIETTGDFQVTSSSGHRSKEWNFMKCIYPNLNSGQVDINEGKIMTGNDDKAHQDGCQLKVECVDNRQFINGVCASPVLLLLEVEASEGTEQRAFRLAIENLIDRSGILTDKDAVLWQDPDTCLTGNPGGSRELESKAGVYYGLYHIIYPDPDKKKERSMSTLSKLGAAMGVLSRTGQDVTKMFNQSRICTLFEPRNVEESYGLKLLDEEGPDLKLMFHEYTKTPEVRNTTVITQDCRAIPWAWSGNIFRDPFVACETVEPPQFLKLVSGNKTTACQYGGVCDNNRGNSPHHVTALVLLTVASLVEIALILD